MTLQNADAVFTTPVNASKVNLYSNFKPTIVVFDEAARATKMTTNIISAFYNPMV